MTQLIRKPFEQFSLVVALRRWPAAGEPINPQTVLTVLVAGGSAGDRINPQTVLTVSVAAGSAPLAGGR